MIDDSDRFLEDADRRDIARIVREEVAKAADPEASVRARFDYDDETDGTPIERRARRRMAERLGGEEIDSEADLNTSEVLAQDSWDARHDAAARELCLPDTEPKKPTRRSGDERNEKCVYDFDDEM